ncbi:MAG: PLP-dependent aminotransferase family protein [Catenulispora sp.]
MVSAVRESRIPLERLTELLAGWSAGGDRRTSAGLAAAIRAQVLDGRLPMGTRLPAERELALALGVSRTLIGAALRRMRDDGMLASRRGSGSWIAVAGSGSPRRWAEEPGPIDLAVASPEAITGFAAAVDAARLRLPSVLGSPGYLGHGLAELRGLVADRYTARGLPTAPEQIVITAGADAALAWLIRTFVAAGDRVVVEHPTYPNALDAIRLAKAVAVPVPLTASGWSAEELAAAIRRAGPALVHLVPEHHNPTGMLMSAAQREQIGRALAAGGALAVCDETLVELHYSGRSLGESVPLAAFAPDRVVAIGSAAKAYWGGLRLGWLRAPGPLADRLAATRTAGDLGAPVLDQLVLAELLTGGDRALARRRVEFAARRDVLVGLLRDHCPQWSFTVPDGGLSLWCRLDGPVSTRLAAVAENHGLRLVPGARFSAYGGLESALRIPFSLPADVLGRAVPRLAAAARAVGSAARGSWIPVV